MYYMCEDCGSKDSTVDIRTTEREGQLVLGMLCASCAGNPIPVHPDYAYSRDAQINAVANNQAITKGVRIA